MIEVRHGVVFIFCALQVTTLTFSNLSTPTKKKKKSLIWTSLSTLPEIRNLLLPKPHNTYLYSRYVSQPYHFKRTQLESKKLEQ